jgi:uncharacterized coiled-coil protein SlyX
MSTSKPATQLDIQELRTEFRETIAELLITIGENFDRIDATHATKDELEERFQELNIKIENLPTRDEFYTYMDKMLGEYKTFNQESALISGRVSNHEDRIITLEKKLAFT